MAFFGLMTLKRHIEAIAHERYFIACRDETIVTRNATIERLQRENARLLAELSPLKARALAQEEGRRKAVLASAAARAQKREGVPHG